jgi:hypothetical protein
MTEAMKPLKSAAGTAAALTAATEVASLLRIWTISTKSRKLVSNSANRVETRPHERKASPENQGVRSERR